MKVLERSARFDLCGDCDRKGARSRQRTPFGRWLYPHRLPDGRNSVMLKVLMTNACENDCRYCVNRRSLAYPRTSLKPEEVASFFYSCYRGGLAHALFLSSGISGSPDRSMERILSVLEILRMRLKVPCYVHTKVLPGASQEAIARAVALSNRVSVNLEAPSARRLSAIAPEKDFEKDLMEKVRTIANLCFQKSRGRCDQTTQFVVGAAGESDREILLRTSRLYEENGLARVYFSAFQDPVGEEDPERENARLDREHRLYQCDFLFRKYRFEFTDLVFSGDGNLPLKKDPKQVWAETHPEAFPVEINRASREALLRVPGIGPKLAACILRSRRERAITSPGILQRMGVPLHKAGPYLLLRGRQGIAGFRAVQEELWPDGTFPAGERPQKVTPEGGNE